jgi:hypothetical protein
MSKVESRLRGMSLVGILVGFAILAGAALILSRTLGSARVADGKLDNQVRGDAILVTTLGTLRNREFKELFDLCETQGAFAAELRGSCPSVDGTTIVGNPGGAPASVFEQPLDWDGLASTSPKVCVELSRCQKLASGKILQITLRGYWLSPSSGQKLEERTISFRKTRW